MLRTFFLSILLLIFSTILLKAQEKDTPIYFITDGSGSMWGQIDGKTKMAVAVEVLSNAVRQFPEQQEIGLVAYGHRKKGDCQDVEFMVDLANTDKQKVVSALEKINPLGKTPLAHTALKVFEKLKTAQQKATVILITDGIESCNGDLCEVVRQAKADGIDFKLHIVGFGLKDDETQALKCAAEAGGGEYYDADDADGLSEVIEQATETTIEKLEKNVSAYATKNGKAVDAMVKFLPVEGGAYKHSLRTYRDTGFASVPPGIYNVETYPLEQSDASPIIFENVQIEEGKMWFKEISFDAGYIQVTTTNNEEGWDATVYIYSNAKSSRASGGRTYKTTKTYEVSPGSYRVELLFLGMKGSTLRQEFKEVQVSPLDTTRVAHNLESGTLWIGGESNGQLVDCTVNVVDVKTKKSVAGSRTYTGEKSNPRMFIIQPGTYEITLKALGEFKGAKKTQTVTIKKGEEIRKMFQF